MAKIALKMKSKPKKEEIYVLTVPFIPNCSYEERESIIRRAIYNEQEKYKGKPFRFIITEKDMKQAKINIFVKKTKK